MTLGQTFWLTGVTNADRDATSPAEQELAMWFDYEDEYTTFSRTEELLWTATVVALAFVARVLRWVLR